MGFEIQMNIDTTNMTMDEKDAEIARLRDLLERFELSKPSYYQRHKERLKRETADRRWCCEICVKEVAYNAKPQHLRSKMHAAAVACKETGVAPLTCKTGFCKVCEIAINARTAWHHERTQMHQKRLAAQIDAAPALETCQPCV
jgi:hypothetical protein